MKQVQIFLFLLSFAACIPHATLAMEDNFFADEFKITLSPSTLNQTNRSIVLTIGQQNVAGVLPNQSLNQTIDLPFEAPFGIGGYIFTIHFADANTAEELGALLVEAKRNPVDGQPEFVRNHKITMLSEMIVDGILRVNLNPIETSAEVVNEQQGTDSYLLTIIFRETNPHNFRDTTFSIGPAVTESSD